MRFKYTCDHLDCDLCADMAGSGCPFELCPHILENLDDLRHDPYFLDAVENADGTLSYHTPTLMYLYNIGFPDERAMRLPPPFPPGYTPAPVQYDHGVKPECAGCPFPRNGQSCHGEDGSCVKTEYDLIMQRSRTLCPA